MRVADGATIPLKVRSIVGVLPLLAAAVIDEGVIQRAVSVNKRSLDALDLEARRAAGLVKGEPGKRLLLLGAVDVERVLRVFTRLFDEAAFLSPYGLRAVSRYHEEHPFVLNVNGAVSTIDYEPAESTTGMFGGNSNWRGPVWFPVNYLVVD